MPADLCFDSFSAVCRSYRVRGRSGGTRSTHGRQAIRGAPAHDQDRFAAETAVFRRELLAHCYRMAGSAHDAEELVQETFLRAWRSYAGFGGRSSVRSWLYAIATNVCLTALEPRRNRVLPSGLTGPHDGPDRSPAPGKCPVWNRCRTTGSPIRRRPWWRVSRCGSR
jgi:hypothetical protein